MVRLRCHEEVVRPRRVDATTAPTEQKERGARALDGQRQRGEEAGGATLLSMLPAEFDEVGDEILHRLEVVSDNESFW